MGKVIKVDERIEFISSSHDHYLLAAIASARDDREAVIRTLKDMTDVGTSITAAYYLLAKSYEAIGDQDLALSNYLKAEILDRRDITRDTSPVLMMASTQNTVTHRGRFC